MSFHGRSFVFNRIGCEQFGLTLYNVDTNKDGGMLPKVKIVEDTITRGYTPLNYGISYSERLTFSLTFGFLDQHTRADAYDVSAIAGWLTGHSDYKWLEICQPDMRWVRYKCKITEIKKNVYAGRLDSFSCQVECDSPFAYTYPTAQKVAVAGLTHFQFKNISSFNGYYCPKLIFTPTKGTTQLTIKNMTDNDRLCSFGGIKTGMIIEIDSAHQIISNNLDSNLFENENTNGNFLRCSRGDNELEITGDGILEIISEFPINVGS